MGLLVSCGYTGDSPGRQAATESTVFSGRLGRRITPAVAIA